MDYADIKNDARRLLMALAIAEANTAPRGSEHPRDADYRRAPAAAALVRARRYAKTILDALGDGEPWMCQRCGQLYQADVGSCRACQDEIVARP